MGRPHKINNTYFIQLYQEGLNDVEIARILRVNKSAIQRKRCCFFLKPNTNQGAQKGSRNPVFSAIKNGNWQDPSLKESVRLALSNMRIGANNPNWSTGASRSPSKTRLSLYGFDLNKCSNCGAIEGIQIHHLDGDKTNGNLSNIQILCRKCHAKKHHWGRHPIKQREWACSNCGRGFKRLPKKENANMIFCSRGCWYEFRKNHKIHSVK